MHVTDLSNDVVCVLLEVNKLRCELDVTVKLREVRP